MPYVGDGYSDGPFVAVRAFATGFTIPEREGVEEWNVDLVDADDGYSAVCWDHYDGKRLDRETAVRVAPEMAAENGWPGLPVRVDTLNDQLRHLTGA